MHQENLKKIQIETEKIIKEAKVVIDKLIAKEKEGNGENTESKKTLSIENLTEHHNVLIGETQKLKSLEYVVAVVGTMKAGKSMTINAIVGQEVLPSREHPMTTLPTLITHVPKQTNPKLTIEKIEPFIKLRDEIKAKITTTELNENDDIKDLIFRISEGSIKFEKRYNGQDEISRFLKDINDLMRIAKEFDIEAPYEEYTNVDDLPRIEVEFYHLSKYTQDASEAKLTLLDTPGPDEFKQSDILKTIFKEQLRKASAVTLVVDYTKMNSESGAEVTKQIEDVADMIGKKHLFVLLNKFDQRGRGKEESIQKKEARRLISDGILKGKIDEKNVYPVASKNAFYANLGLCELAKNQKIDENLTWRESFAVTILGEDWEDDIDDIKRIEKKCNRYWKKSYLEEPLNNIIATIHGDAFFLAIDSSLRKLLSLDNNSSIEIDKETEPILEFLSNGLNIQKSAYIHTLKDLRKRVLQVEKNMKSTKKISQLINDNIKSKIKHSNKNIENTIDTTIKDFQKSLKKDLQKKTSKKIKEETEKVEKGKIAVSSKNLNWLNTKVWDGGLFGGSKTKNENIKNYENLQKNGKITFKYKHDANKFLDAIKQEFNDKSKIIPQQIERDISNDINKLSNDINNEIKNKLTRVINEVSKSLGDNVLIKLPQLSTNTFTVKMNMLLNDSIKEKETYSTELGDGFFDSTLNFFNRDWGLIEKTNRTFEINNNDISNKVEQSLNIMKKELKDKVELSYKKNIEDKVNDFMEGFIYKLTSYQKEQKAILDKRRTEEINVDNEIELLDTNLKKNEILKSRILETIHQLKKLKESKTNG